MDTIPTVARNTINRLDGFLAPLSVQELEGNIASGIHLYPVVLLIHPERSFIDIDCRGCRDVPDGLQFPNFQRLMQTQDELQERTFGNGPANNGVKQLLDALERDPFGIPPS